MDPLKKLSWMANQVWSDPRNVENTFNDLEYNYILEDRAVTRGSLSDVERYFEMSFIASKVNCEKKALQTWTSK